jgi:hypothetical protein
MSIHVLRVTKNFGDFRAVDEASFKAETGELDYAAAAPYAVLLIVISLPLTVLLRYGASQVAGR